MKSKFFILSLLSLVLLLGCSDQSEPVDAQFVNEADVKGPNKPFKITGFGTFEAVEPDGSCDLPLQIALEGSGTATHTGLFSAELTWCFLPPEGPLYIFGTVTAANGDELYIETTDQGVGDNGEVYETFSFLGGTGRFSNASGEFDLYTTTVFDQNCGLCGTYTNYGEGHINY